MITEITREEAIEELKTILEMDYKNVPLSKAALEMAIQALKKIPKLQNRCFTLTSGKMCMFCPYDCEYRTIEHRRDKE